MTDYRRYYTQLAAKALSKCVDYDPMFGKASRGAVEALAALLAEAQLHEPDVLDAVHVMYRDVGPGFRFLPGYLVQAAKSVRRDRTERESTEARQAREDTRTGNHLQTAARQRLTRDECPRCDEDGYLLDKFGVCDHDQSNSQPEINRRGMALVRAALAEVAAKKKHRGRSPRTGDQPIRLDELLTVTVGAETDDIAEDPF